MQQFLTANKLPWPTTGTEDAVGDAVGAGVDGALGPRGRPVAASVHRQAPPASFPQAAQPWSCVFWLQGLTSLRK